MSGIFLLLFFSQHDTHRPTATKSKMLSYKIFPKQKFRVSSSWHYRYTSNKKYKDSSFLGHDAVSIGQHYVIAPAPSSSLCRLSCDRSIASSIARSLGTAIYCYLLQLQYLRFSLRSSSSYLRLLPRIPAPSIFLLIKCFRRQILRYMSLTQFDFVTL
jgi:hypothetical protein